MLASFRRLFCVVLPLALTACDAPTSAPQPPSDPDPLDDRVWLRGDLHLHSSHSEDALDNPMAAIVAKAESLGFDYFVVTDHDNHVEGRLTTWDDPAYRSDRMLLLYGVEWTTARGHANFLSASRFDHSALWALRDAEGAEVAEAARAQALHFSINHPVGSDPWERGLAHDFDGLEVWNALFLAPNDNTMAIALWDELLLDGRRITARGGSDCHHQEIAESRLFNMGNPTTWVLPELHSAQAVIDALDAGHASISYAPTAERLDLRADTDGDDRYERIVGDSLPGTEGTVAFRIDIVGAREGARYEVRVVKNGEELREWEGSDAVMTFDDVPGERAYYRVELRGETADAPSAGRLLYGDFVAMTNPIYFGYP